MRRLAVLLALQFSVVSGWARDFSSAAKGTTTAGFLKLPVDARALAMGEAQSASVYDANALYWNPAALSRTKRRGAVLSHAEHALNSMFFDYAAYSQRIHPRLVCATGLQYFSAGSIAETDGTGTTVGTYNPNDLALSLGCAHQISGGSGDSSDGLSLGLAAKYIRSTIIASAETAAVDIGILTSGHLNHRLSLSATLTNLGGTMRFESEDERLPLAFRLGTALRTGANSAVAADLGFPQDNRPFIGLGVEHLLFGSAPWRVLGRAGLNSRTIGEIDGFSALSFGVGLGTRSATLDYGLLPLGGIGLSHRISTTIFF